MNKNKLIWLIGLVIILGVIISIPKLIQANNEENQSKQETVTLKEKTKIKHNNGTIDTSTSNSIPTTEDLENRLVLGEGPLPQTIKMDNTKIFEKNGINDVFAIQLVKGQLTEPSNATVLTDEVCKPDKYNLYHCWNNIKLSNGILIRGLTIHNMDGGVACFDPGTKVVVAPYKDGYFLLQR